MNIGIDIDDTISNTFESMKYYAEEYIKNVLKREPILDTSKIKDHYYIKAMFGLTNEEVNDFLEKYYEIMIRNVKPKKAAVKTINKLKEDGNKIIIITARWSDDIIDAFKLSEEWLKKQGLKYDKLYTGIEKKDKIALDEKIDLFIDDSINQCKVVNDAGIKSYLFDAETNRHINPDKEIERVFSWEEIYNKVKIM